MTNKQTIPMIVVAVLVLFLLGFVAVKALNSGGSSEMKNQETKEEAPVAPKNESDAEDGKSKMTGSFLDVLNKGSNVRCTFSSDVEGSKTSGEIFVSGKKMKGDFEITTGEDQTIKSHMLSDGEWFYTWSDMLPQGFKMNVSELESDAAVSNDKLKDFNKAYDYECSRWSVDSSYFEMPKGIEFTDFTTMLESVTKPTDGEGFDMCGTCGMMPDAESKQACLTQFKCN